MLTFLSHKLFPDAYGHAVLRPRLAACDGQAGLKMDTSDRARAPVAQHDIARGLDDATTMLRHRRIEAGVFDLCSESAVSRQGATERIRNAMIH